jgi:hypothetical protein
MNGSARKRTPHEDRGGGEDCEGDDAGPDPRALAPALLTPDEFGRIDGRRFEPGRRPLQQIPVASRQDVLEASSGCLTKDVLEISGQENFRPGEERLGRLTSFVLSGLVRLISISRTWQRSGA